MVRREPFQPRRTLAWQREHPGHASVGSLLQNWAQNPHFRFFVGQVPCHPVRVARHCCCGEGCWGWYRGAGLGALPGGWTAPAGTHCCLGVNGIAGWHRVEAGAIVGCHRHHCRCHCCCCRSLEQKLLCFLERFPFCVCVWGGGCLIWVHNCFLLSQSLLCPVDTLLQCLVFSCCYLHCSSIPTKILKQTNALLIKLHLCSPSILLQYYY